MITPPYTRKNPNKMEFDRDNSYEPQNLGKFSSIIKEKKVTKLPRAKYKKYPPYTIFSPLYDVAMGEAALPSIIDAFSRSVKRHGFDTDTIADVGCGTGRFLKYLSRFGSRLFGVDRSSAMLKRAKAATSGSQVEFLEQDFRHLQLPALVDCITCTFDTINYLLNTEDLHTAFRAFARNLKPGGTLILDYIPSGAFHGKTDPVNQLVKWGPVTSQWRVAIDPEGRGSTVTILMKRIRSDGNVDRAFEVHEQRWHSPDEVNQALEAAEFASVETSTVESGGKDNWLHVVARLTPKLRN